MTNIDLRNEYANAKNRAFDQGCEGGFRADYTEWLEQKLSSNTEIIGDVSDNEIVNLLEELDYDAVLYDSYSYGLPIHGNPQKDMIATVRTWLQKSGR